MTVCTEGADSSTAVVAGAEKELAVGPTAPDGTSKEHYWKSLPLVPFSSSPPYEPSGHPPE